MSLVFLMFFLFVSFPLTLPCRFVCFTVVHVWFCFFARLYSPVWDLSWYNIFLRGMFIFFFAGNRFLLLFLLLLMLLVAFAPEITKIY